MTFLALFVGKIKAAILPQNGYHLLTALDK
jgi:hypothetical protein